MKGTKLKNILLLALITLFSNCTAVDTGDPQNSRSIKDSRTLGHFITEYHAKYIPSDSLVVEEAWLEQGYYYSTKGGQKQKIPICQFVFKIKQIEGYPFMLENSLTDWIMIEDKTKKSVGLKIHKRFGKISGEYVFRDFQTKNFEIPEKIVIHLYLKKQNEKVNAGKLEFLKNVIPSDERSVSTKV